MIIRHPTGNGYVLSCFENFRIDHALPKHRKETKNDNEEGMNIGSKSIRGNFNRSDLVMETLPPISWKEQFVAWIAKKLGVRHNGRLEPVIYGKQNPIEMFIFVRESMTETERYVERIKLFEKKLQAAKAAGQTTLIETLEKSIEIISQESALFATGYTKFITEKQVIDFAIKCQKGIRLDWVANFTGIIPEQVLKKKVEVDSLKIFDNYLVMHYDPTGKAFGLTEKEREVKRDPILFGAINRVRKLYFIDDWVNKEDDLTLDEVAKILGHPVGELSGDLSEGI